MPDLDSLLAIYAASVTETIRATRHLTSRAQASAVLETLSKLHALTIPPKCLRPACDGHAFDGRALCDGCTAKDDAEERAFAGALLRLDEQLEDAREAEAGYLL